MSVKVIEKNAGEKIPYTEKGYNLCFDDMLTIKCNKYQKDWPVDIPAKEYEEQQPAAEGQEEGGTAPVAKPLDMSQVTVTLWGLENPVAADDDEEE